jgi:hypothetical protein
MYAADISLNSLNLLFYYFLNFTSTLHLTPQHFKTARFWKKLENNNENISSDFIFFQMNFFFVKSMLSVE